MLIWITGLSGSGKSTLAEALAGKYCCHHLDGDYLRSGVNDDLGFSKEDRIEAARRAAHIAQLFDDCIVSMISPYQESRAFARSLSAEFYEIHLRCPKDTLKARDEKGIYSGEFPVYEKGTPDLTVDTSRFSVEEIISKIKI